MRKYVLRALVLLGVTLAGLFLVVGARGCGSGASRLTACMVGNLSAVTDGRREEPGLLSELRCGDYALPCAGMDFYYSVPADDPRGMDPVVEALGGQRLSLAFAQQQVNEAFLRSGEPLTFAVYTDTAYSIGRLYFTTLPTVSITVTEPDSAGSYDILDRVERAARMSLFDNRAGVPAGRRVINSDTTIRIRGASSAYTPKKSYRLSLFTTSLGNNHRKNKQNLLGLRTDEDWILYSAGGDSERIRNTFFNNMWYRDCAADNSLGVRLGVECRYVEVLMNGQYMGLYTLMYPLDDQQVQVPDDGFYYRAVSYADTSPDMFADPGDADTVGAWELHGPAANTVTGAARWAPLVDYMNNIGHYDGGDFELWAGSTLDARNIIDLHLFLSLIQGEDNYYKNNNIIAYPEGDGTFRLLLAPWDLDLTWGNRHNSEEEWMVSPYAITPEKEFHALWALPADRWISVSPTFRAQMLERWRDLRSGPWSDAALCADMDIYEAMIYGSGAMARDRLRWPTAPASEDLSAFRAYGLRRVEVLDSYFEEVLGK